MIVPNIHELVVEAPLVAESIQPGQFIIVRPTDRGERIPLSVADFDRTAGTITTCFMEVGESTSKLALVKKGGQIPTFVGPLGNPTEIRNFGTVLCIGGCYGIGSIFPIVRALKEAGNQVHVLLEARSSFLIYWEDKHKEIADSVEIITRDGTRGYKGHVSLLPSILQTKKIKPDRIICNGCTFQMMRVADVTRDLGIKTIVSMNPIMIDGTGMCGVCRLKVGDDTKFACVDGPDFDAHLIDWDEFLQRRMTYFEEEISPLRKSGCGTEFHYHPG